MGKTRTVLISGRRVILQKYESQRKDGTFVYQGYDENHNRVQITDRNLFKLREKVQRFQSDRVLNLDTNKRNALLNDVQREWFRTLYIRETTASNYQFLYNAYCLNSIGKKKIREINEGDINKFYSNLIHERHLAVNTVDGLHTVVQQIFLYGVKHGYNSQNPTEGVMRKIKRGTEKKNREILTQAEEARFIDYLKIYDKSYNSNWYCFFAFMVCTGLRIGEMAGLQKEDIDLENEILTVRHNLVYFRNRSGIENAVMSNAVKMKKDIHLPKTEAGIRSFKLNKAALDAISSQLKKDIKCNKEISGYSKFVFLNKLGYPVHQGTVNKALKRIITYANIDAEERNKRGEDIPILPSISSHALRRTFITRCAEAGLNPSVTASMVGHNDIRTTLEYYTVVKKDWQDEEIAKLDQYFEKKNICCNSNDE